MATTSDKIRTLRIQRGLTQEELGKLIGVSKATVNKYESGAVCNLKRSTIAALANVFDCSPAYLMGWNDEPSNSSRSDVIPASVLQSIDLLSKAVQKDKPRSGSTIVKPAVHKSEVELTDAEAELIRIYRALPFRARLQLLERACQLEDENK